MTSQVNKQTSTNLLVAGNKTEDDVFEDPGLVAQLGLVPALHLLPRRVLQADQARVLQVSCSDRDGCKKTSTVMLYNESR
jgi:hypothetical protein